MEFGPLVSVAKLCAVLLDACGQSPEILNGLRNSLYKYIQ